MQFYKRFVKNFLDVIVLKELENGNSICGHEMRALIRKRFHILVPSGTIYSLLYSMERNGLVEGIMDRRKRIYMLTEKGKEKLENISESSDKIVLLIKCARAYIGKVAP
jgi:DNA-binding PadR family transcriptional regulator